MECQSITYSLLKKQNSETSNAVIQYHADSSRFSNLAKVEGDAILRRDQEDADKLQTGIDYAKEKGVIDPKFVPQPYVEINVLGKNPDDVSKDILSHVDGFKKENGGASGFVVVICGLSGTGKGTTVSKLQHKLEDSEEVVCWSNGNIFRSVTLLATTWCEIEEDIDQFDAEKALTKENIALFMSMLTFAKYKGKFDIRINGLGLDMLISQVENTELKAPKVSKNIPTVAKVTQGEVILFAAEAINIMSKCGVSVLVEGREQTVNYIKTPLRFTLVLSDESLIGKRRAAQRIMAAALLSVTEDASDDEAKKAVDGSLTNMLKESGIEEKIKDVDDDVDDDEDDKKAHGKGIFCFKFKWGAK